MAKITSLAPDLCRYLLRNRTPEDEVLAALRRETRARFPELAGMMVSEEQGALLRILVGALAPKLAIEIGTFTGYSAACMAPVLPAGGTLICCDVSSEWTSLGVACWQRCGMADRIDLRLAPAQETLAGLAPDTVLDFAFIDADKKNYVAYYEAILSRMRPNGVIVVDNVLWHGRVLASEDQDPETVGIRDFNDHVLRDGRVDSVMLHVGDGLTLIRKL